MNRLFRHLVALAVALTCGLIAAGAYLQAQDVTPTPRQTFFDDNGVPLAGGLIYTYTAGTSTSAVTYTDSALTTPHANPIVLDSAGRAAIYLPSASFKFVVANSAAVQIYTQDNIRAVSSAASAATIVNVCDGRLTLTSGTPVTTADVSAATTVYFSPFTGTRCALYDGNTWNIRSFSELSLALGSDAANTNYDLFAYDNGGAVTLQRRAWATQIARTTDLTLQDGVYVRLGATTARYLGTYRTTTVAGQTEDSLRQRLVFNLLHPMARVVSRSDGATSWTYTTATFRQANANTLNAIGVLQGLLGGALNLHAIGTAESTTQIVQIDTAIGEDSAIVPPLGCGLGKSSTARDTVVTQVSSVCAYYVPLGYHTYQWLERSTAAGTTTWYGNGGGATQFGGLFGSWIEY